MNDKKEAELKNYFEAASFFCYYFLFLISSYKPKFHLSEYLHEKYNS